MTNSSESDSCPALEAIRLQQVGSLKDSSYATPLIALVLLLPLSCTDQEPPVAQSAFDEQAGPWQTALVNGVPYRRVAAKANATAQASDLSISIPLNDQSSLPDTIIIAGRIYTANCLPDTVDSSSVGTPPVAVDSSSVETPDQSDLSDREILMIFYRATGGGTAWTGNHWGSDELSSHRRRDCLDGQPLG